MNYHFGIEIEVIVKPHKVRPNLHSLRALYYSKLAASLRKRGLKATADSLRNGYAKRPEHYDKWWITKDGSLIVGETSDLSRINPGFPLIAYRHSRPVDGQQANYLLIVPMEAVSPVMACHEEWETQIDTFWTAMRVIFHMPQRTSQCGSHIHVSNGSGSPFTLQQLKTIAFGIALYEPLIEQLLMANRTTSPYCVPNTRNSTKLSQCSSDRGRMARLIRGAGSTTALSEIMQNNRYVLWNFENTLPGRSGTVEFRGGRCLRGEVRTKRWIACTISLIDAILSMNNIANPGHVTLSSWSPEGLYEAIKTSARRLAMMDSLPTDYRVLNESRR